MADPCSKNAIYLDVPLLDTRIVGCPWRRWFIKIHWNTSGVRGTNGRVHKMDENT